MARSFAAEATASFAETIGELDLQGSDAAGVDPHEVGRRAALLAASMLIWRRHLGALLETSDVQVVLGVGTRQAIADLRARHRLLGLSRKDGSVVYPAFQFVDGRPFPEMPRLLLEFKDAAVSPWTIASWFVTPQDALEGSTPVECLTRRTDGGRVIKAARRTASRLRR